MSYHSTMKHVKGDPLPDPVKCLPGGSPLYMAAPAGNIRTTAWLGNLGGRHRRWRGTIGVPHCKLKLGDPPLYMGILPSSGACRIHQRAHRALDAGRRKPPSYVLGDPSERARERIAATPM